MILTATLLFAVKNVVSLVCQQNSDQISSKEELCSYLKGTDPTICLAVNDEVIHWEAEMVHQVILISKPSLRMASGWNHRFSKEIKELEITLRLLHLRNRLLCQCCIRPEIRGFGQPDRASKRLGTSMSLILRAFNKEKIQNETT